ncbi:MAG: hypothetical protein AAF657_33845 [Acidobacteriota bacterium]
MRNKPPTAGFIRPRAWRPGFASWRPTSILCLLGLAITGDLVAEVLELPTELNLGADSHLVLELDQADLHLTGRVDGLPVLRARRIGEGVVEEGGVRLEAVSSGGRLTVRRGDTEQAGDLPRLRLDVALGPGRTVYINGVDLEVRARDSLPQSTGRNAYHLMVERTTVQLTAVRLAQIEATASSLRFVDTVGSPELTLRGGAAQLQGHQGRLELAASAADVAIVGPSGEISVRVEGGSLEVSGGEGSLAGTVRSTGLALAGWRGDIELQAADSTIDASDAEVASAWHIEGRELQGIMEQIRGGVVAIRFAGGAWQGSDLHSNVQVTAENGAQLDLAGVHGSLIAVLSDGTEGWISRVAGPAKATVIDSRLELAEIDQLTLLGDRAEVVAGQIAQLSSLRMADSNLELDLRETRRGVALDLQGASYARVLMQAPCIVQSVGEEGAAEPSIDVAGCDLRAPGEERARQQPGAQGTRTTTLTVTASAEAVVGIEGDP